MRLLLLWIGLCRANLKRIYIIVFGVLINPFFHPVEPLDTSNFYNRCN